MDVLKIAKEILIKNKKVFESLRLYDLGEKEIDTAKFELIYNNHKNI